MNARVHDEVTSAVHPKAGRVDAHAAQVGPKGAKRTAHGGHSGGRQGVEPSVAKNVGFILGLEMESACSKANRKPPLDTQLHGHQSAGNPPRPPLRLLLLPLRPELLRPELLPDERPVLGRVLEPELREDPEEEPPQLLPRDEPFRDELLRVEEGREVPELPDDPHVERPDDGVLPEP